VHVSRPRAATAITAGLVAAGLAVAGVGVFGLLKTQYRAPPQQPAALTAPLPAPTGRIAAPPRATDSRPVATPVRLTIPVIGVDTTLTRLGLTADGSLQVPSNPALAGWYIGSSRPGAIGPAVIVGHIDSYTGPGVFYRLAALREGNRLYISRADGTLAIFRITEVRTYPKNAFPTQAVYEPTPDPELRLITCGGAFDVSRRTYLSNVIVFAAQVSG
jgi:Sortase domain